jgi:hypothetical protein
MAATSTDNTFHAFLDMQIMDPLTVSLIEKVCLVAAGIAAICFVSSLAYNYFKSSFKSLTSQDTSEFPNYMEIGRGIVMLICISSYSLMAQALAGSIDFFNSQTSPTLAAAEAANQLQSRMTEEIPLSWDAVKDQAVNATVSGEAKTSEQKKDQEMAKTLKKGTGEADDTDTNSQGFLAAIKDMGKMLDPVNLACMGITSLCHLISGVINLIVAGISMILFKILLIIGPLAFAFSILPAFEKQISIWFGTLMNVGFVFTTLNVTQHLFFGMYDYIYKDFNIASFNFIGILVFDIVMIVVTCSCFWITSKFVGKGDGGRVVSKMVAISTATAGMVAKSFASSPTTGGNLGNIINAGKGIVRDEK